MEERVWEEGHVNIQAAVCPSLIVISVAPSLLPVYIYSTSTNTNTNTNTLKMHKYNDQKTNCWLKKEIITNGIINCLHFLGAFL